MSEQNVTVSKDALSSTPRTDAAIFHIADKYGGNIQLAVSAEFAGQLERELNEALDKVIELSTSNIELRASMAKDAARYRWLRDATGNSIVRNLMKICTPDGWDSAVDVAMRKRS